MKRSLEDLELRSESVQMVLTEPPAWILRHGITIIFAMLILLFGVTFFIRYPDVIEASATVTTQNPPQRLEAKISGKLAYLAFSEPTPVQKGDVVAVIESAADPLQVRQLKQALADLDAGNTRTLETLGPLALGTIQPSYSTFRKAYLDRSLDSRLKPFEQEIASGRISEQENRARLSALFTQQQLEKSKLELSEQQYKRAQDLFTKGVISASDLGQQKTATLQARQSYDQITLSISQQREAISVSKRQVSDGQVSKEKTEVTAKSAVSLALDELRKSITEWENDYLILAPANGMFALQGSWRNRQSVQAGDVLATLMPDAKSAVWGALTVAAKNSGKIETGQKVLFRLDNFPYQEFGTVTGKVLSVSPLPDEKGQYFVTVALPRGLETSYGKKLNFTRELSGNAQIVTQDMRLIERFFYTLMKAKR